MRRNFLGICISFLLTISAVAQSKEAKEKPVLTIPAKRVGSPIKLDGTIDDAAWKDAPLATNFIEWRPNTGLKETYAARTEMYILYDDEAIYVAGYCHEASADSVSKELAGRDGIGSNDFVAVFFDTYNDKINASGFFTTPLGEQYDAKYSEGGNEDDSWNAVWYSEAKIVKDGWTFEMKIPYSALRFNKNTSTWGINFMRRRAKTDKRSFWSPVLPTVTGLMSQEGLWQGITGVNAPVRLSFSPYFSTYVNHYPYDEKDIKEYTYSVNGGMDLKYGINESYTLDMTLIPDFGQVQSDKKVLNLTPFEVQYQENRPFFTEGTELFSKGSLFYSRRVGAEPIHKYDVEDNLHANEVVIKNPSESRLYNATKISGRNKKGLGTGFFNAISRPMYAVIEDTVTHEQRKYKTGPLTNYNIVVLDQTMKNNSSISFINTSVIRDGIERDADVMAALYDIYNKKKSMEYYGKVSASFVDVRGYSHNIGLGKVSGRFNFSFSQSLADKHYNKMDMGIMQNNDYLEHYLWLGYKWVKAGKWYNNMNLNFNNTFSQRFSDMTFQRHYFNVNTNINLKNLWGVGMSVNLNSKGNDFYEPHASGYTFKIPQSISVYPWFYTNSAKKYYFEADLGAAFYDLFKGRFAEIDITQRYRFSDKVSASLGVNYEYTKNNVGFADFDDADNVIFGKRNITTIENSLSSKYSFSKKSWINLVARHYWSRVDNKSFFTLSKEGDLQPNTSFAEDVNQNANYFNIDMTYSLEFAPGSFLNIVWKNYIPTYDQNVRYDYFTNLNNTVHAKQNNNLSLKVIYYLDYLKIKKHR